MVPLDIWFKSGLKSVFTDKVLCNRIHFYRIPVIFKKDENFFLLTLICSLKYLSNYGRNLSYETSTEAHSLPSALSLLQ